MDEMFVQQTQRRKGISNSAQHQTARDWEEPTPGAATALTHAPTPARMFPDMNDHKQPAYVAADKEEGVDGTLQRRIVVVEIDHEPAFARPGLRQGKGPVRASAVGVAVIRVGRKVICVWEGEGSGTRQRNEKQSCYLRHTHTHTHTHTYKMHSPLAIFSTSVPTTTTRTPPQ